MFFNKQFRQNDKLISNETNSYDGRSEEADVINVKIDGREQLYSSYSYSGDKLNGEFSEYVFEKAKSVPIKNDITIRLHTKCNVNPSEVGQAIKGHYRSEYSESKKEHKRITLFSVIMTLLGIIALTALILINHFTDNLYITSIVEIAAWVFIWEAVDSYFLQRPVVKAKCILIQRIYTAKIEICNDGQTDEKL